MRNSPCIHLSILLAQVICPFNSSSLAQCTCSWGVSTVISVCHSSWAFDLSVISLQLLPPLSHCSLHCPTAPGEVSYAKLQLVSQDFGKHSSLFFHLLCFSSCSIPACALASFIGRFILPLRSLHASACCCLLPPHLLIYVVVGHCSAACNSFKFFILASCLYPGF